ncbi:MAG: 30S ribosomal protein S2, partial [Chitinivibrionales bacterium]
MASSNMKELLEAGVHFGHQTMKWNPKMGKYILCQKNGIYIIDLKKSITCLDKFIERVKEVVSKGEKVLFVGTKKQVKNIVKEEAKRCGMHYVVKRWQGGMLTNYKTCSQSIKRLEKIEEMEKDGTLEHLTKKEGLKLLQEKEKKLSIFEGIRDMKKIPAMIFIVDSLKEHIAVREAKKLNIPVGGIIDTNADPEDLDYPIPGNDDAIKSVQCLTSKIADAILEASKSVDIKDMEEKSPEGEETETEDAEQGETEETEKESEETEEKKSKPKKKRIVRKKTS